MLPSGAASQAARDSQSRPDFFNPARAGDRT
jgi:hypothetical protein